MSPSTEGTRVTANINQLVDTLLKEHVGGQRFFTAMDEAVREPDYFLEIYLRTLHDYGICASPCIHALIVTGQFGIAFANWWLNINSQMPIIVVRGGLKHNQVADLPELNSVNFKNFKNIVLLDDTLYAGVTMDIIRENVERRGGKLTQGIFCYDGGKEKRTDTISLYRYYDHHGLEKTC